ncbi:MAG: hypothetical protein K6B68_12455 [Eubacterium sp.]|nr:hypothetical protein [Eubacterium sp.]
MYLLDEWRVAIAAPSYIVSLSGFTDVMKNLQRELFEASEKYIAIIPVFCIIRESHCNYFRLEEAFAS